MKGNEFRDGWKEDERARMIHSWGNCLLDSILANRTDQPEEVKRAGAELLGACPDVPKKSDK